MCDQFAPFWVSNKTEPDLGVVLAWYSKTMVWFGLTAFDVSESFPLWPDAETEVGMSANDLAWLKFNCQWLHISLTYLNQLQFELWFFIVFWSNRHSQLWPVAFDWLVFPFFPFFPFFLFAFFPSSFLSSSFPLSSSYSRLCFAMALIKKCPPGSMKWVGPDPSA